MAHMTAGFQKIDEKAKKNRRAGHGGWVFGFLLLGIFRSLKETLLQITEGNYTSALSTSLLCLVQTSAFYLLWLRQDQKKQKSQSLPQDCLVCCLLVILCFFCFFCFPVLHSSHLHVSANAWTCIVSIMSVLPLTPSGATVVCRQVAASCNVSRPVTLAHALVLL